MQRELPLQLAAPQQKGLHLLALTSHTGQAQQGPVALNLAHIAKLGGC